MQIIAHLDKILTEKGISVARFAEDSGIPPPPPAPAPVTNIQNNHYHHTQIVIIEAPKE